jgi:hypothetical protein
VRVWGQFLHLPALLEAVVVELWRIHLRQQEEGLRGSGWRAASQVGGKSDVV